jgi:hypothetical protein
MSGSLGHAVDTGGHAADADGVSIDVAQFFADGQVVAK